MKESKCIVILILGAFGVCKYWKRILYFLILWSLSACSQHSAKNSANQEYSDFIESSPPAPSISTTTNQELSRLSEKPDNDTAGNISSKRFDVVVRDVSAKDFFVGLVSQADVNVVVHPELEGSISLDLRDVTVAEVLSVVRDVYGYEFKYQSRIYTIYPRILRTEIFPINYLDIKRVGVTDTSVLIGEIGSSSGGNSGNDSRSNSASQSSSENTANLLGYLDSGEQSSGEGISPGSRVQTLSQTDFWGTLKRTLMGIIGNTTDGRFVMTNSQAGMVVVRAMPAELNTVRSFLQKSELGVKRQIVLETKILEVQLNDDYETGINWASISGDATLQSSKSGIGSIDNIAFGGEGVNNVVFSSTLSVTDISKLINLLDRQGDVSVLSSPRISTVNNQKAIIRVGSDEFFVTGIRNSQTASAASVTNTPEIELSSFFSGISLDVTPQISENGDVIIHIHPIVSSVQDQLKEIQVGDDNFSLPLALRDVRESDSIVRARSGQVVVLGGLMQETSSDVDTRRGVLGSIPLLNILFKHRKKELKKSELVILMRPIIIDDLSWENEVGRDFDRFGSKIERDR